jgi:sulfur dioxygenase
MANIEVSLSATARRKKSGSVSGMMTSPKIYRHRDFYKELNSLRMALRDKENIIQTFVYHKFIY